MYNKLSVWKRPFGAYKNGKFKWFKISRAIKWFASPHKTIPTVRVGASTKIKLVQFNPGSRLHVKKWLDKMYGITSTKFTAKGNPKWSADVMKSLANSQDDPKVKEELQLLQKYLKCVKSQGALFRGDNALLRLVDVNTNRIHGSVDTLGASTTSRMSASKPNLQQVDSSEEFRELFVHKEGHVIVGADLSNIEIRLLAHFLAPYDGGKYIKKVLSLDMHWHHAQVAGLAPDGEDYDEHNPSHVTARKQAKALVFGINYGSGTQVIGYNLWFDGCLGTYTETEYLSALEKLERRIIDVDGVKLFPLKVDELIPYTEDLILKAIYGARVVDVFKSRLDGYKDLLDALDLEAKTTGHTTIIDGRKLASANATSKLNYLLQGTASVVTKKWIINFYEMCEDSGLTFGKEYWQCAVIHDELIITCEPKYKDLIASLLEKSANKVTRDYNFSIAIEAEAKIGKSWWDVH